MASVSILLKREKTVVRVEIRSSRTTNLVQRLKLHARRQFKHASGIATLRFSESCTLNVGAPAVERYRRQLKNVEDVVSIHLETQHYVAVEGLERRLLREAHVSVEVARTAEAVAANARYIERCVYACRRSRVEVCRTPFGEVGASLPGTVRTA